MFGQGTSTSISSINLPTGRHQCRLVTMPRNISHTV
jgi:hypothetical protein